MLNQSASLKSNLSSGRWTLAQRKELDRLSNIKTVDSILAEPNPAKPGSVDVYISMFAASYEGTMNAEGKLTLVDLEGFIYEFDDTGFAYRVTPCCRECATICQDSHETVCKGCHETVDARIGDLVVVNMEGRL